MYLPLFLLFILSTSWCADARTEYGSGNIIIQPENKINSDSNSAVLLSGQFATHGLKEIEDTNFVHLLSHVVGTQPFDIFADRNGFPQTSLFEKPKALVFFTLDSVGSATLNKFSSLSMIRDYQQLKLTTQSSPPNTYSLLASLATGALPSTHGIVGKSWQTVSGERVIAYSADGQAQVANIADIISQEWPGQSVVVSASASASLAGAFAPHAQLIAEHPSWPIHVYSLEQNGFSNQNTQQPYNTLLALSNGDLYALLGTPAFASFVTPAGGASEYVYGTFRVTLPSHSAVFDLKTADFGLFAELGFVYNFIAKLKSDEYFATVVSDSAPDMFTFTFSSLKDIKEKYGEESQEFAVAIFLVDNAIQQFTAAANELYSNRVASSVIVLDAHHVDVVASPSWLWESNGTTPNTTTPDSRVPVFHLLFWVTFILIFFLIAAVCGVVAVGEDATRDSLLYRSTGRHHHQS